MKPVSIQYFDQTVASWDEQLTAKVVTIDLPIVVKLRNRMTAFPLYPTEPVGASTQTILDWMRTKLIPIPECTSTRAPLLDSLIKTEELPARCIDHNSKTITIPFKALHNKKFIALQDDVATSSCSWHFFLLLQSGKEPHSAIPLKIVPSSGVMLYHEQLREQSNWDVRIDPNMMAQLNKVHDTFYSQLVTHFDVLQQAQDPNSVWGTQMIHKGPGLYSAVSGTKAYEVTRRENAYSTTPTNIDYMKELTDLILTIGKDSNMSFGGGR